VTLKSGVMMLKIQLYITEINYILKYIPIFTILLFYCTFDQINLAFFSRTLFQKLFQTWHVSQIIIYTYLQQKQ